MLSLEITMAYLNILLAKEQSLTAQKQLAQSKQQLQQVDKKIATGLIPAGDRLEIVAQTARNEQTLVAVQNTIDQNYLTLKKYLEVAPDSPLTIEVPEMTSNLLAVEQLPMFDNLYKQALQITPMIKAGELQVKSAALVVAAVNKWQ